MLISRAKLLILIAIVVVVLVELRTILGFFGLELSPVVTVAIGAAVIGALLLWAMLSTSEDSDRS